MWRLDFEAPLRRTLHVITKTARILTDPEAVVFGFGQGETARARRRQPVIGARHLEATAIGGDDLATRRDSRSGIRLCQKDRCGDRSETEPVCPVIVQPGSDPVVPADRGAGDWQPLIKSSMKSRSGAKLAGCPPIDRTIGIVSSAARYQILSDVMVVRQK
jgi:hypothetical protein